MGRNILFITTDQQRYDALGCNGGRIARTPVADRWASQGIRYSRAQTSSWDSEHFGQTSHQAVIGFPLSLLFSSLR